MCSVNRLMARPALRQTLLTSCLLSPVFCLLLSPARADSGCGNSGVFTIDNRSGTGVLSGLVIGLNAQGQSQGPLADATVSIPGVGDRTTNDLGEFTFGSVPEGTYTVTASKSGYLSVSRSVTLRAGETKNETFQLTVESGSGGRSRLASHPPTASISSRGCRAT